MKVLMTSGYDFMLRHTYENEFGAVLAKPYRSSQQLVREVANALAA